MEDFDEGWNNDIYLTEIPLASLITLSFHGNDVEAMEQGWQVANYAWSSESLSLATSIFNTQPFENFGAHWNLNQNYAFSWSDVDHDTAEFAGGMTQENFVDNWQILNSI